MPWPIGERGGGIERPARPIGAERQHAGGVAEIGRVPAINPIATAEPHGVRAGHLGGIQREVVRVHGILVPRLDRQGRVAGRGNLRKAQRAADRPP